MRVEQRDHTQELHVQLEQRFGTLLDLDLRLQFQIRSLSNSNGRDSLTRSRVPQFTGPRPYRPYPSYNLETSSCATSICRFSPGTLSTASVVVDSFSASALPVSAPRVVSRSCYGPSGRLLRCKGTLRGLRTTWRSIPNRADRSRPTFGSLRSTLSPVKSRSMFSNDNRAVSGYRK